MTDQYNTLIQKYTSLHDLPWRLVYYQMDQESSGIANLIQHGTGALGLLQLMPSSFPAYTKDQLLDPETNIKLGVAYLAECIAEFKKEVGDERLKFGLAAYNAGLRNILVAQNIAQENMYPTDKWASVGVTLTQVTGINNALQTNWYVWIIMSDYKQDQDQTQAKVPA